jgi:hypothetical protein
MKRNMSGTVLDSVGSNAGQPWDEFDSFWYLAHNYEELRFDDRQIIEWMADFFASAPPRAQGRGIDVGSGTNLYPAMAMLPLCHQITMIERAASNVAWLSKEVYDFAETWNPFWGAFVGRQARRYGDINPRAALEARAEVIRGDVFKLPTSAFDAGTMFFVAESITARREEFERATQKFISSLKRRAPFAAAFMKNSQGYRVGAYHFPAVAIDENGVRDCLASVAYDVEVHVVSTGVNPLRDGYEGMMLATGFAGKK